MLLGEQAPPRVLVAPGPARANSWEDVADLSARFGLVLDPWQEQVLRASLGERANGKWLAHQVGVSAPRQNGKSQLIVARALAGALLFDEKKIVVSAHQQDTARETFDKFISLIEDSPALEAHVAGVMNALNREHIRFRNGAKIQFKARSGAGGRGFSSDCLFLDEAQILGPRQWASINSTMSARPNPQVWLMGTPPTPDDDAFAFTRIRDAALSGKATSLAYLEWSAEPGDDPASSEARAKANPAWDTRINHDVVQGEFETYTRAQFALERLGMWPDEADATGVIDLDKWRDHIAPFVPPDMAVLAVETSRDRQMSCMVAVSSGADGVPQVRLVESRPRTGWVAGRVADYCREFPEIKAVVLIGGTSSSGTLVEPLEDVLSDAALSVDVVVAGSPDYFEACAVTFDLIHEGTLRHKGDAELDAAVRGAVKRESEGAFVWSRSKAGAAVVPLVAMSLGLWEWRRRTAAAYDVMDSVL